MQTFKHIGCILCKLFRSASVGRTIISNNSIACTMNLLVSDLQQACSNHFILSNFHIKLLLCSFCRIIWHNAPQQQTCSITWNFLPGENVVWSSENKEFHKETALANLNLQIWKKKRKEKKNLFLTNQLWNWVRQISCSSLSQRYGQHIQQYCTLHHTAYCTAHTYALCFFSQLPVAAWDFRYTVHARQSKRNPPPQPLSGGLFCEVAADKIGSYLQLWFQPKADWKRPFSEQGQERVHCLLFLYHKTTLVCRLFFMGLFFFPMLEHLHYISQPLLLAMRCCKCHLGLQRSLSSWAESERKEPYTLLWCWGGWY